MKLCAHLVEFLDVTSGTNQILRHYFACVLSKLQIDFPKEAYDAYHLASFGGLLDVHNEFFLLLF